MKVVDKQRKTQKTGLLWHWDCVLDKLLKDSILRRALG